MERQTYITLLQCGKHLDALPHLTTWAMHQIPQTDPCLGLDSRGFKTIGQGLWYRIGSHAYRDRKIPHLDSMSPALHYRIGHIPHAIRDAMLMQLQFPTLRCRRQRIEREERE